MTGNTSDENQVAYGGLGRRILHGFIDLSQMGLFRHTAKLLI